jgi:hypothetical protein
MGGMICSLNHAPIPTSKSPNAPFAIHSSANETKPSYLRLIVLSAALLFGSSLGPTVRVLYWILTNRTKAIAARPGAFAAIKKD